MFFFVAVAAGALFGTATATHMDVRKRTIFSFHIEFAIVDIATDATVDVLHIVYPPFVFQYAQKKEK